MDNETPPLPAPETEPQGPRTAGALRTALLAAAAMGAPVFGTAAPRVIDSERRASERRYGDETIAAAEEKRARRRQRPQGGTAPGPFAHADGGTRNVLVSTREASERMSGRNRLGDVLGTTRK